MKTKALAEKTAYIRRMLLNIETAQTTLSGLKAGSETYVAYEQALKTEINNLCFAVQQLREDATRTMSKAEFDRLVEEGVNAWLPANGGAEEPIMYRNGRRLLYAFNPASGKHAYVDVATDVVLSDDEALSVIQAR